MCVRVLTFSWQLACIRCSQYTACLLKEINNAGISSEARGQGFAPEKDSLLYSKGVLLKKKNTTFLKKILE